MRVKGIAQYEIRFYDYINLIANLNINSPDSISYKDWEADDEKTSWYYIVFNVLEFVIVY